MKTHRTQPLVLVLIGFLLLASSGRSQRSDILPAARRQPAVDQASAIVAKVVLEPLAEDLNNPFYPNSLKVADIPPPPVPSGDGLSVPPVTVVRGPTNNFELLETIAPQINPTGTMILGGQPLLLFGQKKVKVGDELPIIYEGQRHVLIISAIESSHFTLRLGNAEFTRPIKSEN